MAGFDVNERAPDLLPAGFTDLEVFVSKWALAREMDRINARWTATMPELRCFYDAMLPRLDSIIEHLNRFPLDEMPAAERRLFHLAMSMAEIADAVETFGSPEVPYAFHPTRYPPTGQEDEG